MTMLSSNRSHALRREVARHVLLAMAAAVAWLGSAPALADVHAGFHIYIALNGSSADSSGGLPPDGTAVTKSLTVGGVAVNLMAAASQFTAGKVSLTGTGNGHAKIHTSSNYQFHLQPPAGANAKGGKLVLNVVLEGSATGNADVHLVTAVQSDFGKGTGSAVISDDKTPRVTFDVEVPIAPFIDDLSKAFGTVHMQLDTTANLTGAPGATATAEATTNTRIVGFRVLNSSGAQISGFTLVADGGNIPEAGGGTPPQPPTGAKVAAVEFYNAAFKHYFVSANTAEIAKLDDGTFAGWTRTGQSFSVNATAGAGLSPVCRLFTVAFPPTSSHFYAPRGLGCEGALANDKWQYEGEVFFVPVPTAAGACPAGSVPVYRLYNNGRGGAPNHRFTTSDAIRTQMLAEGFVAEGAGSLGVGFCALQ